MTTQFIICVSRKICPFYPGRGLSTSGCVLYQPGKMSIGACAEQKPKASGKGHGGQEYHALDPPPRTGPGGSQGKTVVLVDTGIRVKEPSWRKTGPAPGSEVKL